MISHEYLIIVFSTKSKIVTGNFDHVPANYFATNRFNKLLELDSKIRAHPVIVEYCKTLGIDPSL